MKIYVTNSGGTRLLERFPLIGKIFITLGFNPETFINFGIKIKSKVEYIIFYFTNDNKHKVINLPCDSQQYLKVNNPRLIELKDVYSKQLVNKHSVWKNHMDSYDLTAFRSNMVYLSQRERNINEITYLITATYVEAYDKLKLSTCLYEDNLFGIECFNFVDGVVTSRDLLDSILEINFLEDVLKISKNPDLKILDVGAGYGRLAYRLVTAMTNVKVYCTDAVPESTFICEYYLKYRNVQNKAITIHFNEIEKFLSTTHIDIAINVHSFSECTLEFVEWWLSLLKKSKIKYLMIVPHDTKFTTAEINGTHLSFLNAIESYGYKLMVKQPKYNKSKFVNKYGLFPEIVYYMFKLDE